MGAAQGTTTTFDLILEGVDLTEAAHVYATFKNKDSNNPFIVTKSDDELVMTTETDGDVTSTTISVTLTQEQTINGNKLEIQVNWTYADGTRASSEIGEYRFDEQLLNEVVE